jgi:hypothetical protein
MKVLRIRFVATSLMLILVMCVAGSMQTVLTAGQAKEFVQLAAHITMMENLLAMKGRSVTVTFPGGQITGTVKDASNGLLHLEKLSQKEFYDAIIRVDNIIALEARVR